jgi:general secretion pathway protein A
MKTILLASLFTLVFLSANAENKIGVPAKGGHPEYLFLEKVSESEAQTTADMISKALAKGRLVIFAQMKKLTNPKLGDKGFTGDVFAEQWKQSLEAEFMSASPAQERIIKKLIWAGKQAMDNNQDRLNVKGVKWKHFLPAKWAREAGLMFNSRTGIVTKQPAINYRHPSNAPDAKEVEVLTKFVGSGKNAKPQGEFAMMGKQKVYRYFDPINLMPPCLGCHGKPKGSLDMLGFQKDGLDAGDVIGLISVSVAVEN